MSHHGLKILSTPSAGNHFVKVFQNLATRTPAVIHFIEIGLSKGISHVKDYAGRVLWVIIFSYLISLEACVGGAELGLRFPNITNI
ncbi:hypothetical protein C7H79_16455 [Nitrosomonas supralitoralis]|uniref:Uncharacterized protein n=1 Tax=Nitrosomonas supralitoralis TaxID=2116706 RepID=A0A2P7NR19_9PROT|nr:hypothetical protein C7H79_16455 [Nitrosomonas supralitoralis]